jgi:hypothetical protein
VKTPDLSSRLTGYVGEHGIIDAAVEGQLTQSPQKSKIYGRNIRELLVMLFPELGSRMPVVNPHVVEGLYASAIERSWMVYGLGDTPSEPGGTMLTRFAF